MQSVIQPHHLKQIQQNQKADKILFLVTLAIIVLTFFMVGLSIKF